MSQYNLAYLNDKDFEALVVDLLSAELGCRVERFKSGKDGGVDGRYFQSDGGEAIIQCKHWEKSGFSKLLRELQDNEISKVNSLEPKRYFIVTSIELSRANKKAIHDALEPWVKSESDVWGKEDIFDLLDKHSSVLERHYKLWITSASVLQRILNFGVVGQSRDYFRDIIDFTPKYVPLSHHNRAINKLEDHRVVIITGEGGIGKTTLANQMAMVYHAQEYEFIFIKSIEEAADVWADEKKQLFYFDDFLGRNYLEALERHEGSSIVNFMTRVSKNPTKRFILTSRTTILNQGWALSDSFGIANIEKNKFEISVTDISEYEKALILYNHIWFSQLDDSYIDQVYFDKRYRSIVAHKNFNPRIISLLTEIDRLGNIPAKGYWDHIVQSLDNPQAVWENAYLNQIDDIGRWILPIVVFNGGSISEKYLRDAYAESKRLAGESIKPNDYLEFDSSLRVSVGAVLRRKIYKESDHVAIDLFNPSVGDYIIHKFANSHEAICSYFSSLMTPASLSNLVSLYESKAIRTELLSKVICELALKSFDGSLSRDISYRLRISQIYACKVRGTSSIDQLIHGFLLALPDQLYEVTHHEYVIDLIKWAVRKDLIRADSDYIHEIIGQLLEAELDEDTLQQLDDFIHGATSELVGAYASQIKAEVLDYWSLNIEDFYDHDDFASDYTEPHEIESAQSDFEYGFSDYLTDRYNVDFTSHEVSLITDQIDVVSRLENHFALSERSEDGVSVKRQFRRPGVDASDAIDDLFQRPS